MYTQCFLHQKIFKQGGKPMPLSKDITHSKIVEELMQTYTTIGKIGDYTPKSKKEALEIANTIAFKIKGKSND